MTTPRCVHCPAVPATHTGCLTGKRICAKHACVECRPLDTPSPADPAEARTPNLFGCKQ